MAEISYYDADLSDAIEKLNEMMGKLAKAPPGIKPELLSMVEKKMKETIELKKGYQLALRQAPREEARSFRERFDELSHRVEELTEEVKWVKTEHERSGLFGDRTPLSVAGGKSGGGQMGNKEMLDKAGNIQKKTEQSLVSTQKMVENSKEVAIATGEQLREQRQQVVQITDEVMRMEDNLQHADKLICTFARRMATNRLILVFTLLVFCGIAGIVIYKSVHPEDKTFYVPDEVTPPNPAVLYNKTVEAINNTLSGS
ncbi:hypothetical protein FI667_g7419, partial [Globisporangium splendens]